MIEYIIKTTALPKPSQHISKPLVLETPCCDLYIAFITKGSQMNSSIIVDLHYSCPRENQDDCSPQTESTYLETHPLLQLDPRP